MTDSDCSSTAILCRHAARCRAQHRHTYTYTHTRAHTQTGTHTHTGTHTYTCVHKHTHAATCAAPPLPSGAWPWGPIRQVAWSGLLAAATAPGLVIKQTCCHQHPAPVRTSHAARDKSMCAAASQCGIQLHSYCRVRAAGKHTSYPRAI